MKPVESSPRAGSDARVLQESPVLSAYHPPRVERLGDVRDLTFGPSPGTGDSLDPGARKVAGT